MKSQRIHGFACNISVVQPLWNHNYKWVPIVKLNQILIIAGNGYTFNGVYENEHISVQFESIHQTFLSTKWIYAVCQMVVILLNVLK